jgi:acyl-CoA thioesterase I
MTATVVCLKRLQRLMLCALLCFTPVSVRADSLRIVALGASNTYGKGVARSEAYPAQLASILRGRGYAAHVINAGVNGDTTGGMLGRLDRAVASGTDIVILQPGGNDRRQGIGAEREANVEAIRARLRARSIQVIMLENGALRPYPRQPDGQHLTPEGYRLLAESLAPMVVHAIGR